MCQIFKPNPSLSNSLQSRSFRTFSGSYEAQLSNETINQSLTPHKKIQNSDCQLENILKKLKSDSDKSKPIILINQFKQIKPQETIKNERRLSFKESSPSLKSEISTTSQESKNQELSEFLPIQLSKDNSTDQTNKNLEQLIQQNNFLLQCMRANSQSTQNMVNQIKNDFVLLKNEFLSNQIKEQHQRNYDILQDIHLQKTKKERGMLFSDFDTYKQFKYVLELAEEFMMPLYRERNFSIKVNLKDANGKLLQNTQKIIFSASLYSSETLPQPILYNNSGAQILKGTVEREIKRGVINFEKLQIKEVSSHFLNGWVYIVIKPVQIQTQNQHSETLNKSCITNPNLMNIIDLNDIKPLVIDSVRIKAKKIKQKDN